MVKLVKNRAIPILEYVRNKKVLEIGCVGMGKHDTIGGKNFIAGYVKSLAKKWVGIDINKEGVKFLRSQGFDVRVINAEKYFNLREKFDVILAEEVIEHLTNLPIFLRNVYRHLKDNGLFIITTPNPISPSFFFQRLLGGKIRDVSINHHTFWSTHETLIELLRRYKFKVIFYEYIHPLPAESTIFYEIVIKPLWKLIPNIFGRNLLVIALKVKKLKRK
jgi:SAM-dependent methyltransferase